MHQAVLVARAFAHVIKVGNRELGQLLVAFIAIDIEGPAQYVNDSWARHVLDGTSIPTSNPTSAEVCLSAKDAAGTP